MQHTGPPQAAQGNEPPLGQRVSQEERVIYLVLVLNLQQRVEEVSAGGGRQR